MPTAQEAIAALEVEVTRNGTVDGSAQALILALATMFEAAKMDPVAVQSLVDRLRVQSDDFGAFIVANTPQQP